MIILEPRAIQQFGKINIKGEVAKQVLIQYSVFGHVCIKTSFLIFILDLTELSIGPPYSTLQETGACYFSTVNADVYLILAIKSSAGTGNPRYLFNKSAE